MNGCGKEAELRRPESPWTSSRFVIWSVLFTCLLSYCTMYKKLYILLEKIVGSNFETYGNIKTK
jgi:hypothetical protein